MARYDTEQGRLKSADGRIESVIDIHHDIEPTVHLVLAYNEKSITLRNQGILEEALTYSDSAIVVCNIIEDISQKANVYSGRGRVY